MNFRPRNIDMTICKTFPYLSLGYKIKFAARLCICCLLCLLLINVQHAVNVFQSLVKKQTRSPGAHLDDKLNTQYTSKTKTSVDDFMGKVLSRTVEHAWKVVNKDVCNKTNADFVLAYLKFPPKTPIYVYPKYIDHYVSTKIIDKGWQEPKNTEIIIDYMKRFPNSVFIDLGANIGAFSITLATLGYKVIAVECLRQNVERLCASMELGRLDNKMAIIHNAVTDKHETVSLSREHGNVGMTQVKPFRPNQESIATIQLDDLLEMFNLTQVILKMDVERYEHIVLNGAHKFFERVRVEAVLMEWAYHRADYYGNDGKFIVNFLDRYGLEPDVPERVKHNYSKWNTYEVLFKRKIDKI